jgi:hypothetical protein
MGYVHAKPKVKRVELVGEYAGEWIEFTDKATNRLAYVAQSTDEKDKAAAIFVAMITDWSLKDEDGSKLPISIDTFYELPADLLVPLYGAIDPKGMTLQAGNSPKKNAKK